jgi:hypothetical protein
MRRLLGLAVALVLAVGLAAGCGGGGKGFPTGKWTATNEAGDVAVMDYRSDGTWVLTANGDPLDTGDFSTDGNTITFETDAICKAVGAEQGTYTWTDENNQLTFKKQTDLCTDRVEVLEPRAWAPVK